MLTRQTGTLSQLLSLSDMLPKLDSQFTQTVSKTLDTLRSLTDDGRLSQHARINDRPVDEALMQWKWDRGRWGEGGKVAEVIDALTKVGLLMVVWQAECMEKWLMRPIAGDELDRFGAEAEDAVVQPGQGQLDESAAQTRVSYLARSCSSRCGVCGVADACGRGNLSQRSLLEVVKKGDLVENSEFMETLVVAVPKYVARSSLGSTHLLTDQEPDQGLGDQIRASDVHGGSEIFTVSDQASRNVSTGRLADQIYRQIAADDEYSLRTVTVFKKVRDEFTHRCRENKCARVSHHRPRAAGLIW